MPRRGQAGARAGAAHIYAEIGRVEDSLDVLSETMLAIERGSGSSDMYPLVALAAAETLWILQRRDYIESIERNVLQKIIEPDFRYPMRDARRSMAHLCALQGRYDEARDWFAKARGVLEEDGQRPLRALVDFDEALMWVRRGRRGDRERASPAPAMRPSSTFSAIGMPGWEKRANELSGYTRPAFPDRLTGREVEVLQAHRSRAHQPARSPTTWCSACAPSRATSRTSTSRSASANKADATAYAIRHGLTG